MSDGLKELLSVPWVQKLLGLKNLVIEDDTQLELTWTSAPPAWVMILLIVPAVLLLATLIYRAERRDIGRVPKVLMWACRVGVVLLIIALLCNPTLTVEVFKEKKAYVLVLVDDSLSMGKADRPKPAEDQKVVARAVLEKVPETLTPEQVDSLRALSRLEIVLAAMNNPRTKFIQTLQNKINVAFYSFAGKAVPRETPELAGLAPRGRETAIGDALAQALAEKRGQRVLGAIIFSDGRSNTGQDPEAVAKQLGERYVAVYTVAPGVAREPMDVRLRDLQAPEAAIANNRVRVSCRIQAEGYAGEQARLRLYLRPLPEGLEIAPTYEEARRRAEATEQPEADKTLALAPAPTETEFTILPREPGLYELLLLTDVLDGEATAENNFMAQRLQVVGEKVKILYVDHWPRWEYRFLKNALIRDTKIQVHVLLTSADETFTQDHSPDLEPLQTFPETLKDLLAYDVVILGDVPLGRIGGAKAADLLAEFASEHGGGIILISGTDSNPRGYRDTPLAKVLPVVVDEGASMPATPFERELPYRLSADGEEHEATRLDPDKERNRALWMGQGDAPLPRVRFYTQVKRPKANAKVLVELQDPALAEPVPLFVVMFYGRGHVFYSATDETYRWRWLRGDNPLFYPFWQNVVSWARKGKIHGIHRFRLSVDKDRYAVGETVQIYCTAFDQDMNRIDTAQVPTQSVNLEPPNGERLELTLQADEGEGAGLYRGTFSPHEVGEYRLWAGEEAADSVRFSVLIPNREEEHPIIDEKKLRAIAAASYVSDNERARAGNENFYRIDQLDELARSVRRVDIALRETREDDLWDAPLVYLVFAVLITVEWILRKIYRML
jgi:uncharacterized membrane protein